MSPNSVGTHSSSFLHVASFGATNPRVAFGLAIDCVPAGDTNTCSFWKARIAFFVRLPQSPSIRARYCPVWLVARACILTRIAWTNATSLTAFAPDSPTDPDISCIRTLRVIQKENRTLTHN